MDGTKSSSGAPASPTRTGRDDVHEQREDGQPADGVVSGGTGTPGGAEAAHPVKQRPHHEPSSR